MATPVQITPMTLTLLAGILTILTAIITVFLTSLITGSGKVSSKEFRDYKEDHYKFCPENRDLLTKKQHEVDCHKNLEPIKDTLVEIKEDLKDIKADTKTNIKIKDIEKLIRAGLGERDVVK